MAAILASSSASAQVLISSDFLGETARIQRHLRETERALRDLDVRHLSPEQRRARLRNLDRLHEYWVRGRFPANLDFPGQQVPYLVDAAGTPCAIAHLMLESGATALAKRLVSKDNNAWALDIDDAEFFAWLDSAGLTLQEAALIQPTYCSDPGVCGCGVPDDDSDGDGTEDCIDGCPTDPNKQRAGICGCGTSDVDTDSDGTRDCNDGCPSDGSKTDPGVCGCGVAETDSGVCSTGDPDAGPDASADAAIADGSSPNADSPSGEDSGQAIDPTDAVVSNVEAGVSNDRVGVASDERVDASSRAGAASDNENAGDGVGRSTRGRLRSDDSQIARGCGCSLAGGDRGVSWPWSLAAILFFCVRSRRGRDAEP